MKLSSKIILLLLLLICFIAGCVHLKIDEFIKEFAPNSLKEELIVTPNIIVAQDKEESIAKNSLEEETILEPLQIEETTKIETENNLNQIEQDVSTKNEISLEQSIQKKELAEINLEESLNNDVLPEEVTIEEITETKPNIQDSINIILKDNAIMFQRMSSKVAQNSQETIEKIAHILKDNPNIKIEIAGHTDAKGDDAFNQTISEQRANSVKELLVSFGVEDDRLSAKGYGETKPLVPNDKDGYSLINRRVEFNIVEE